MKIDNGDFASAIEALASKPEPASAAAEPLPDVHLMSHKATKQPRAGTAQEMEEFGLQAAPEVGASLEFPPQSSVVFDRPIKRHWARRLGRSLFALMLVIGVMLGYVGSMADTSRGPDGVFSWLSALAFLLPVVVWVISRNVSAEAVRLEGYPMGELASLPLFGGITHASVMRPDDEVIEPEILTIAERAQTTEVQIRRATDLWFDLSDLLVKRKHTDTVSGNTPTTSQAEAAVLQFRQDLAAALGEPSVSVMAAHTGLSEDFDDNQGAAMTFVCVYIKDGQRLGLDVVCRAIVVAAEKLQTTFEVTEDG